MRTVVRGIVCLVLLSLLCPLLASGQSSPRSISGPGIIDPPIPRECRFIDPGDANSDGQLDIGDVVYLVNLLCHNGPEPDPLANGDATGDCVINLDDVHHLINYMFRGGPPPEDCVCDDPVIEGCVYSCAYVTPGDANDDGSIDISDVVFLINMLCHEGSPPIPLGNGDVNADCEIDLDDVIYLIDYMFKGGPPPMDCVCGAPTIGGCEASCEYVVTGDANTDGEINISDVVFLINMLCHGGPPPVPLGNGDVNADCLMNLDDVYYLIDYMFEGGPPPMDCVCGAPTFVGCEASCNYVFPGDANDDGSINIGDVTFLINLLCHDGPPPVPLGNGDVNADCIIDLGDVYYLVAYMFEGGPAPMDCVCGAPTIGDCFTSCEGVLPGDANTDGMLNISDVVFLVNLLCHDGPPPNPLGNGDVNADCVIDGADLDYLIAYMFEGGPAPMDCICGNPTVGDCPAAVPQIPQGEPRIDFQNDRNQIPQKFDLHKNIPNPFNPSTEISFALPQDSNVSLVVYNLAGEQIRTLADGAYQRGVHRVVWDGRDTSGAMVSAGVYFYTLITPEYTETEKMVLIK